MFHVFEGLGTHYLNIHGGVRMGSFFGSEVVGFCWGWGWKLGSFGVFVVRSRRVDCDVLGRMALEG